VSIRKTLLLAFLGVGLISALVLASLAFFKARQALQAEIERGLAVQAASVAAEADKMMFERLQNAATWSRLDIMQDLQVHDVDKRLSRFLVDLQSGYGDVYLDLSCVDTRGQVIASSKAARIGLTVASTAPTLVASHSSVDVALQFPADSTSGVVMQAPITSEFGRGNLGWLRLQLDWARINDVLDQAGSGEGRMAAILDADGKVIAASAELRRLGMLRSGTLADWREFAGKVSVRRIAAFGASDFIGGVARSPGYTRFAGFGWTTLVIQPVDRAFAPVDRMAHIFLALFALIMGSTVLTAIWVSRKISEPIRALTEFATGYMGNKALMPPPAAGRGEVGELTRAFVQMVRDIDQSQKDLVRASKLAVVGEMSSIIAHEVRTPLGILRSSAQILRREPGITSEGKELVGFIESETERLNRLVSAMLDTARPRTAVYRKVNLHDLIHTTVAMLTAQAEKGRVTVDERFSASDAVVECDDEKMTQVLLNILMNGLQILGPGGRIEVSTSDAGELFCIEISDDGPGIAPAERAGIFDAFFSRREGGIGLGLAIVQEIILDHGGRIEAAESRFGGALFRIVLSRERMGST
jgi:two-component system sensor histidine kinase HydH